MRDVRSELFAGLVRQFLNTVAEFVSEAVNVEKTVDMRSKQYDRHVNAIKANTTAVADVTTDALREIIREEQKILPTKVSSLK